jgi:oligo-1,6-glucosidase
MMFHFQHMEADCIMNDWIGLPFRLKKLKRAFSTWQAELHGVGWNALYLENHDHPRIIDRYGSRKYRVESAKMLAACYLLQSGTPFVYQGQEIGMTNMQQESISKFKDVVTFNNQKIAKKLHLSNDWYLKLANRRSRENARTPMQWDDSQNGGFCQTEPWFGVNQNYKEINVAKAEADPNSVLHWYRALLAFRKQTPMAIYGAYEEHLKSSRRLYVYSRAGDGRRLLVICSFCEQPVRFAAPVGFDLRRAELLFCNYAKPETQTNAFITRPFECRIYQL